MPSGLLRVPAPSANAGGLLSGIAQHPAHLLRIQAGGASGGRRSTEKRGDAVGTPMAFGLEGLPPRVTVMREPMS